jgi:hypothetical protein
VRRKKTPQEKKRLSYLKDRRDEYGENDKSSRKNLPRSKAFARRSNRARESLALRVATGPRTRPAPKRPSSGSCANAAG